jgi:hypothetical protein
MASKGPSGKNESSGHDASHLRDIYLTPLLLLTFRIDILTKLQIGPEKTCQVLRR